MELDEVPGEENEKNVNVTASKSNTDLIIFLTAFVIRCARAQFDHLLIRMQDLTYYPTMSDAG